MDTDVASFLTDTISDKPPANIFSDGSLSDDDDDSDLIDLPWADTATSSDLTGTSLSLAGLNDDLIFSMANSSIPETFPVIPGAPPALPMHSSDIIEHVVKVTDGIQASRDYVTIPVTRERTTTEESEVKLEDFGLDETFFEGIAAKDVNSLLKQFEEATGEESADVEIDVDTEGIAAEPPTETSSPPKRTYGIASKGKLIPRSGQATPSMPCSPDDDNFSSSSSSSSESESESENEEKESEVMKLLTSKEPVTPVKTPIKKPVKKPGHDAKVKKEKMEKGSEVMKLLTSKEPITPSKSPSKSHRQSLSAPNSPPHAPSQEVIRKIQSSTKPRSTVLLTNAVPAKGERGGRAVALTNASMPRKLQRIFSQHDDGSRSAPASPTHARLSPAKTVLPAKSSKPSSKENHEVSADYYSLIMDHDYCQNVPFPSPTKNRKDPAPSESKPITVPAVPTDRPALAEPTGNSAKQSGTADKPKNKISVRDYLNKLKAGEVKRPPRPKPPEHNPMVLPPSQTPVSDSLNDKDGSVLKGLLLHQNLQEELKRKADEERINRTRKSSVNLDVVGMELDNSDDEKRDEKPARKRDDNHHHHRHHREKPQHKEPPRRPGAIPRRAPGSSSHWDRDLTRRSPLENLHPTRTREQRTHSQYSNPPGRRSRSPPPKMSRSSPPPHSSAVQGSGEPPRVPPPHHLYDAKMPVSVPQTTAGPCNIPVHPVAAVTPLSMAPPVNVPPPQVVANIPPPNMQHGLHMPHIMPPPPCIPPPVPPAPYLPPLAMPPSVVPPVYPNLPAPDVRPHPGPVYNQLTAAAGMLVPVCQSSGHSVAPDFKAVQQSSYVSPHGSRAASPEPAPPGVDTDTLPVSMMPLSAKPVAPVSVGAQMMETSDGESENEAPEPMEPENNVVIKHDSPVAKEQKSSIKQVPAIAVDTTTDTTVHDMSVSMDEDDVDIEGLGDDVPLVIARDPVFSTNASLAFAAKPKAEVTPAVEKEDDIDIVSFHNQGAVAKPSLSPSENDQQTSALSPSGTSPSKDINQNKTDTKPTRSSRVAHRNYRKRGLVSQTKDSSYIDKLPSYLSPLKNPTKEPAKEPQKSLKASESLKSLVSVPAAKPGPSVLRGDAQFNKLPDYLSCFTNNEASDGMDESIAELDSRNSSRSQSPNLVIASRANSTSRPASRAVSPAAPVTRTKISPIRYSTKNTKRSRSRSRSHSPGYSRRHRSISRSRSRSRSFHRRSSYDERRRRKRRSYSSSRSSSRSASRSRSRSRSRSARGRRSWLRSRSRSRSNSRSRSATRRYRSRSSLQSNSISRSRSRSGSRSRSVYRDREHRGERRRARFSRSPSGSRDGSRKDLAGWDVSKKRQIEERRIVYVGRIPEGTTRRDLVNKFERFGDIIDVSVHFRDEGGDNYGFVTFQYTCDAFAAIDKGNTIPGMEDYDLCFGGRREFCKSEYEDLDGNAEDEEELGFGTQKAGAALDFDELLRQAMRKSKC